MFQRLMPQYFEEHFQSFQAESSSSYQLIVDTISIILSTG